VADALAARIVTLPEQLRRSITWDHGKEMAQHARFSVDTGVEAGLGVSSEVGLRRDSH
jgi:transposase, IS30 family